MLATKSNSYTFQKDGVWYFSRRVPADLRRHYRTGRIVKTLLTAVFLMLSSANQSLANSVSEVQQMLNQLGYNAGAVDGSYGSKTQRALEAFYSDNGSLYDGKLDENEIADLRLAGNKALAMYCGEPSGLGFNLVKDVGFGDRYEKSLSQDYKPYGACIISNSGQHPIRYGSKAIRFEVRDGDCGYNEGGWSDCTGDRARHELAGRELEQAEYWYSWSLFLPEDFPNVFPAITAMGQFQTTQQDDCSVSGCDKEMFWMFDHEKDGLYFKYPTFIDGVPGTKVIEEEQLRGRWNDFIVNAKWASKDGFVHLFVNGTPVFLFKGETSLPNAPITFKFGIYQSLLTKYLKESQVEQMPIQIAYFDEVRTSKTCDGLNLQEVGYNCQALTEAATQKKREIAAELARPKYDRTRNGLDMRLGCLGKALSDIAHERPLTDSEVELLIQGLEGNDFYRNKRHLVKLGLSKEAVKAHRVALLRLVNFEGTNEAFCAKPLR